MGLWRFFNPGVVLFLSNTGIIPFSTMADIFECSGLCQMNTALAASSKVPRIVEYNLIKPNLASRTFCRQDQDRGLRAER
jgi:hypothetical protein